MSEVTRILSAIDRGDSPPAMAQLVNMRYFAGLSVAEAAGLSRSSAYEHRAYAPAFLHCELYGQPDES
jgi:hypothetical protein